LQSNTLHCFYCISVFKFMSFVDKSAKKTAPSQQNLWENFLSEAAMGTSFRDSHVLLLGPRNTGKRSLINSIFQNVIGTNLSLSQNPSDFNLQANPQTIIKLAPKVSLQLSNIHTSKSKILMILKMVTAFLLSLL